MKSFRTDERNRDNDVFIANGIASFFGQLGGSIGVPIGNALLLRALHSLIPQHAPSVSADSVIKAGPTALGELAAGERAVLAGLRQAWALAVGQVNILLVAVICVSVPMACGMKWLNIKTISREREERKARCEGVQADGEKVGA